MPHRRPAAPRVRHLADQSLAAVDPEAIFDHLDSVDEAANAAGSGSGNGHAQGPDLARGSAQRIVHGGRTMFHKRYHRGGLVARVVHRTYAGIHDEQTRMWREFRLLADLRRRGLPVPVPVAARCEWMSPVTYRGELVTEAIPDTRTLAETLSEAPLEPEAFREVGRVIGELHRHRTDHADLNAHNILRDRAGGIHIIDFDRGRIRRTEGPWCAGNLARLIRSLNKLAGQRPGFHWSRADQAELERGYAAGRRPAGDDHGGAD